MGQKGPEGLLENIREHRLRLIYTNLCSHTVEMRDEAKWIYENARFRMNIDWGVRGFFEDSCRIYNMIKKPGRFLSFDDSVKKASGRRASNLHVRIAPKNNDSGFKFNVAAGSLKDVIDSDPFSEDGKFRGAGYVHYFKLDTMKKYAVDGD